MDLAAAVQLERAVGGLEQLAPPGRPAAARSRRPLCSWLCAVDRDLADRALAARLDDVDGARSRRRRSLMAAVTLPSVAGLVRELDAEGQGELSAGVAIRRRER